MGCFKISPSLRAKQDCSRCEVVSKKMYVSNYCHQITNMTASSGKYADLHILNEVAGFRQKRGMAVSINSAFSSKLWKEQVIWVGAAVGGLFTKMWSNSPSSPFHFGRSLPDEEIRGEGILQGDFWSFSPVLT